MKKIVIGSVLALAAATSFASDVSVSAVHDYQSKTNGVRLETSVPFTGLKASVTTLDHVATRVAVGKEFSLANIGPVNVGATVSAVYQDTRGSGSDGYGLTVGTAAKYDISKNVQAFVGVERFVGQQRVSKFDGNVAVAGLNIKF